MFVLVVYFVVDGYIFVDDDFFGVVVGVEEVGEFEELFEVDYFIVDGDVVDWICVCYF